MSRLKLFHFPGACSRVTMTALEHIGCPFQDELIDLPSGEQAQPSYKNINPRGKVPALLADGELLTENVAILWWLHTMFPQAALLPTTGDGWRDAQILSDLAWISSTLHPYVRANRAPSLWTTGDILPVRERGKLLLRPCLDQIEERLRHQPWWYGDAWSIVDTYIYWVYTTAEVGEFSLGGLTAIADHRRRVDAQPALQRALIREQAAAARRNDHQ